MVSKRQPVTEVHVDQTLASATARVHLHLPPELAPSLLEHRFQIINLWRPIGHPAFDMPLTLCDFRTVDAERDLVAVARLSPERKGETYRVRWNPEHRWKYLKGMTPEEFVLIKWCVPGVAMYLTAMMTVLQLRLCRGCLSIHTPYCVPGPVDAGGKSPERVD